MVRYLAHDPLLTPMEVLLLATHQAARNQSLAIREGSGAVLCHDLFWPSMGVILTILRISCAVGLVSKVAMIYMERDHLDLGVCPEQVARLVTMEPGKIDGI